MDKEAVFVKAFEAFVGRLTSVCKEPRMNIKNIINTKSGRQALIQFAAEAATGIEKNWQENGTPEWVVREMVAAVPEIQTLKRILVLFNIEFLECLIKERGIDPATVDFGYDSDIEGAIAERVYGAHAFSIGDSLLKMQMATSGNVYDVVLSNPPYQTEDGGFGASARPVYHDIVMYTIDVLKPRYVCMITPSRWMAGGKGLNDYRARMLADKHIRMIQDFPGEREVFPTVSIKGGVSYFLWDRDYQGLCDLNGIQRDLNEFDVLVRDNTSAQILRKVLAKATAFCDKRVLPQKPFGLRTFFKDWVPEGTEGAVKCYAMNRTEHWVNADSFSDPHQVLNKHKVCIARARSEGITMAEGNGEPSLVTGYVFQIPKGEICVETYIVIGAFSSKQEADNYEAFVKTKIYRFCLMKRLISQDVNKEKFAWVPDLGDYSKVWTDAELYQHFVLTKKEQEYVEKSIKAI
jgi:site-specific DNA-methyltransferase (adenine-specific)